MAQRDKPNRPIEPGTYDAVPEADRAEQAAPAYPDDAPYTDIDPRSVPDDMPVPDGPALVGAGRDEWTANPADIVEQAIPVPLGDDYDGDYDDNDEP
ncbi:hypothetical protein [Nocardia jinanensis]|uniref:Uncharacterized protein n=1 Tax=Nocardia jinanensis TaxID=382504 RepID=A0A917RYM2_9NOCA|nr:hypothetical protein [Nocardia jinanensis]GGL43315.1 hypothetical protein GCM10011588_67610 [Nocardia jinanensis]